MAVLAAALAQALPPRPMPVPVTRLDGATASSPVHAPDHQAPGAPAPLPIAQIDDTSRAALDGLPTVSLSISHALPLRDVLRLLVAGTPLSIVFDGGVDGAFEGDLKGLTLRQALQAVLFPRALDYDVHGTLIRVFPRRVETRLFDVNAVNVRRSWQRSVRSVTGVPGGDESRASAQADSDPLGELERGVQALLSDAGRMHLDRHAGLVQVTDFADRLDRVALYLEAAEGRASRQVRIEARIFEVTLNDASASTIDWRIALARAGTAVRREPSSAGLRVSDFAGLMNAIAEQGTLRTIAAPTVTAMHNEPAVMRIGIQEVYFIPASQVDASGRVTERSQAPASVLAGLTLTVTPQVAADGIVRLHVAPTYAQKTRDAKSREAAAPVLSVAEADTHVRVQDGETVVIAGLLQERDKPVPGTGFAGFFGAQARETVRSEIVILLTPTIVAPAPRALAGTR